MNFFRKNSLHLAWGIALISTTGSLFFSEVLKFSPCILCWYQRILMYPLVVILFVGILRKEKFIYQYVLPFTTVGLLISSYHNLLYYKMLPDSLTPCTLGISCTTKFIELFGFMTIPFLSFCSFLLITIFMLIYRKTNK